jgi:hypothetical protein
VTITASRNNGIFPVGPVIDATHMVGPQSETWLNINPANPNQLFVGANDLGLAFSGSPGQVASTSSDGGLTWTFNDVGTGTGPGNDGLAGSRGDPANAWDSFGNLFVSYIQEDPTSPIGAAPIDPILMSTDGGHTFTQVAALADPNALLLDQESLAVGPGPGGQGQVLWIIATDFTLAGPFLQLVAALPILGPGQVGALTTPQVIPGSDGNTFNSIAVGPDGQVAAVFETATGGSPGRLQVSVNPTGLGGTFGTPVVVAGLPTDFFPGTNKGGPPLPPAAPERGITMKGGIAYDTSNGPHRGRLYTIYTNTPATLNPASNIFLQFSDDGGRTWSAPLKVNDDTDNNSHFFPRVAVDPSTGYVAASWYDCRNDLGQGGPDDTDGIPNTNPEFYAAVSFDGGASFQPNIKLEPAASSARANLLAAGDANNFGDYTALDFRNGVFHAAWADNSASLDGQNPEPATMDVATVAVRVPVVLAVSDIEPNDTSDKAHKFGTLPAGLLEAVLNQVVVNHSNNLPDYDWFRWSAGANGVLSATFSTAATNGALEMHVFKLGANNTLVELGSTVSGGNTSVNGATTLSTTVRQGEQILVEVKGVNSSLGVFGTGIYNVEVGLS